MGKDSLWTRLMLLSDAKLKSVIYSSIDEYYQMLANIATDIYDSCIQDFYSQYMPRKYKRHGDIKGFNLYSANQTFYDGDTVNVVINEDNLMSYGKHDKREIVLDFVLAGLRGGPLPQLPDWPQEWYTTYPNAYSKYKGIWQSSEVVLEGILNDFCSNVVNDTLWIVLQSISKKI